MDPDIDAPNRKKPNRTAHNLISSLLQTKNDHPLSCTIPGKSMKHVSRSYVLDEEDFLRIRHGPRLGPIADLQL